MNVAFVQKIFLVLRFMIGKDNSVPAINVYVLKKANHRDWLVFICTNTTLNEEEIIEASAGRLKYFSKPANLC